MCALTKYIKLLHNQFNVISFNLENYVFVIILVKMLNVNNIIAKKKQVIDG